MKKNSAMKKTALLFIGLLSFIALSLVSCDKDNFNFDKLNSVEATGEWGIPLVNAQYSVEEILNQLNNEQYISTAEDGSILFSYKVEKNQIIKAADFLSFDDISLQRDFHFPNTSLPGTTVRLPFSQELQFESEQVLIQNAQIKSGILTIDVTNNIDQEYSLEITCPNIHNSLGQDFHIVVTSLNVNTYHQVFDISDYSVTPEDSNGLAIDGEIYFVTGSVSPIETYTVHSEISISDFSIKSLYGKLAEYSIDFSESVDFNLFSDNYGGDITIYNPKLKLYTLNSFLVTGRCQLDTAEFSGGGESSSLLATSPVMINIPISPLSFQEDEIEGISDIHIKTTYDKFKFSGKATINPTGFDAGTIYIDENSTISLKLLVEIPLEINIHDAFFRDTIDFKLDSIENIDIVESATIRLAFTNTLPINVNAQVLFYDSASNRVADSLLADEHLLYGSFNGYPATANPIYIEITKEKFEKILTTDKIILRLRINTGNNQVHLNASQYVKAAVGIKVKYNSSGINLSDL